MRAGVTLLGMATTLRCTCHLLREGERFSVPAAQEPQYLFWLSNNLWQQRCQLYFYVE